MLFPRDIYKIHASELQHSEEFISETIEYADTLTAQELPVIFSTNHLALKLGSEPDWLKYVLENRELYYQHYSIKKKHGGKRMISNPSNELKAIQSWVLTNILSKVKVEHACNSYLSEKNILTNATPHSRAHTILRIDMFKFFDTITENRVYGIFKSLGYHGNLAVDLAKICTVPTSEEYWEHFVKTDKEQLIKLKGHKAALPQGAPTSPALSNLVTRRLDRRLTGLALKHDVKYTRYADDLILSGNSNDIPSASFIYRLVKDEGFYPNYKKTKIMKKGNRQIVTGLTVSDGIHIPKKFKKQLFRILHFCEKYGTANYQKQSFAKDKAYFREWLLGKIFYVRSIDKSTGDKLLKKFNKLTWEL